MRILIGYDGSAHSDAAIEDLRYAGLPRDSEALVVTVGDLLAGGPPLGEAAAEVLTSRRVMSAVNQAQNHAARVIKEAEGFAEQAVEKLRSMFPEWEIERRVVTGAPAWELIDAAQDWNADLVVLGSQGRSPIGQMILGSVSKKVVTDSHNSVRVSRYSERKSDDAPPKIIVGIDGSPAAEEAVNAVGHRVWPDGTEVRLVAAHDRPSTVGIAARLPHAAGMVSDLNQSAMYQTESMLDRASQQLKAIGLNVSISIQKGDPKRILLKEALKWKADSIFVGTRDIRSGLERFRLGSVSTAVVTKAHCSVEVVRPPE